MVTIIIPEIQVKLTLQILLKKAVLGGGRNLDEAPLQNAFLSTPSKFQATLTGDTHSERYEDS
ncbi:hypothetical protein LC608_04730 [Nostoc sp. XA010]|uniref:hypothetical protein n=1 Tax=Nostoc sp. XA010 TaxID=2780407 RepID=UPI001E55F46D|nr:hypothetical protein [Nostoc sp. XA010]MCC5656300.1 hypothetical protein [Nostoc sp. XA010]